jgi:hypothetical protein
MMSLDLRAEHDGLRTMMREFAALLLASRPDMAEIARRRIAFSQAYRRHVDCEAKAVRMACSTGLIAGAGQAARIHTDRVRELFLAYSAHVNHWTPGRIADDWAGYGKAVQGLQRTLHILMAWEEEKLHGMLTPVQQAERTTQSEPVSSQRTSRSIH